MNIAPMFAMTTTMPDISQTVYRALLITADEALADMLSTLLAEQKIEALLSDTLARGDTSRGTMVAVIIEGGDTLEEAEELAMTLATSFDPDQIIIIGEYDDPVRIEHGKGRVTLMTLNRMEMLTFLPPRLKKLRNEAILRADNQRLAMSASFNRDQFVTIDPSLLNNIYKFIKPGATPFSLLIRGEQGVGKKQLAMHIHARLHAPGQPFVSVNCAVIPKEILQQLIFGEDDGDDAAGSWHEANGGTLFLEEPGYMAEELQNKVASIMRSALEKDNDSAPLVIVSAMNTDTLSQPLLEAIGNNVIDIAPLRERLPDIDLLASHFIDTINRATESHLAGVSADAMKAFKKYPWEENARELEFVIEGVLAMIREGNIELKHIPERIRLCASHKKKV